MQFNKQDLGQLENIMRALRSGTFTMQGLEILAFSDCMKWASRLHESITKELALLEQAALTPKMEVKGSPFKESPIQPTEKVEVSVTKKRK